jgi:hypothetical protein
MDSNPRARIGGSRTGQLVSSRRGALVVAVVAALAAGGLFYLFASHLKNNTVAAPTTESVFVASKYIPKGTASAEIAAGGYLERTTVPTSQVLAGAITDPSEIANAETSTDIEASQQVTVGDFTKA